jgi:hypothetical protein
MLLAYGRYGSSEGVNGNGWSREGRDGGRLLRSVLLIPLSKSERLEVSKLAFQTPLD